MKKILDVTNRSRARNSEHYQLYSSFLRIIPEDFAAKYKLLIPRARFAASFNKENDAYLQNQAYEGTKLINHRNSVCDRRYRSFDLSVQSKELSDNPAEAEAAKRISFMMNPYRGTTQKPQAENIAMVKDLVDQLESDKYASDVATLGLTAQVVALKSAVEAFEAALSGRAGERLLRVSTDNMKKVRPIVEQDFADLADLITSLYLVSAYVEVDAARSAELGAVVDAINAEIIRFQDTLSRRGAGSASSPGKDEELPDSSDDGDDSDDSDNSDDDDNKPIEVV